MKKATHKLGLQSFVRECALHASGALGKHSREQRTIPEPIPCVLSVFSSTPLCSLLGGGDSRACNIRITWSDIHSPSGPVPVMAAQSLHMCWLVCCLRPP